MRLRGLKYRIFPLAKIADLHIETINILQGLLSEDLYLCVEDSQFALVSRPVEETVVHHKDFDKFIHLCRDYSDYVPGDS